MTKLCCEFFERCNIRQKVSIRMLVISGTWLWEKWYGTYLNKPSGGWNRVAENVMINFAESGHLFFFSSHQSCRKRRIEKQRWWKENHSLHRECRDRWTDSSHGYVSISSVSTEQSLICAMSWIQIMLKVWSVNLWWYRLRVPTQTPCLSAQHHQHRETCCKIISRNSQNLLKIRNCRNFAKMLVFLKKIEKGQFLHHNWGRIWDFPHSISRIRSFSKPHNIPTERVDLFKCEDRPSFGCETLSSRRTLLYWHHDRTIV